MNHPSRRSRQGWAVAAALLGLAVIGVIACEVAGWPFLAAPVQRSLSKTLHREVQLNHEGAGERATVRFFGGLKVKVPELQIAAPDWSQRPYFLHATNAEMHLAYGDLWRARRGEPLDINLLHADKLVVHAERLADGRASWAFGDPSKTVVTDDEPRLLPTVHELRVLEGQLTFVDAPLKANITAKLQLSERGEQPAAASAPAPSRPLRVALHGLIASAEGTYGPARLTASLRSTGVAPLLREGGEAVAVPVVLELKAGKAALSFEGTVTDVFRLSDMTGTFRVSGPSLAAVGDPLGVTLPTTNAFALAGRVAKRGDVWNVATNDATVGDSKLTAAMTFDTRPRVPMLSGRVSGPRLLLADLAPTIGGEPGAEPAPPAGASAPAARVIPDKEFDLPSLRAMNANVLMSFDRVELGSLFAAPLQPLKTQLTLQDGKLRLDDLTARTADGNLAGQISLDGTGEVAQWQADLRWWGVKLENWLKQDRADNAPPYVSGSLVGQASLKGRGRSTAQILGSLDGNVATTLRRGQVSHLVIEGAGLDIAEALGVVVKGDDALPVSCALADMQAQQGVLRPRAFVVETGDSTLWANGSVSLKDEALDLRVVVAPKDFSPLALRSPLKVEGTFGSPEVSIQKGPLVARAAGALLLSLVNPLAALVPFIDPGSGDSDADSCSQTLERAREAGRLQKARSG
jgi:uncharacterized protein involved in outer membrane biogenesis